MQFLQKSPKSSRVGFRRHARHPLAMAAGERVVLGLLAVRLVDDAVTTGPKHGDYSVCVTVVITVEAYDDATGELALITNPLRLVAGQ